MDGRELSRDPAAMMALASKLHEENMRRKRSLRHHIAVAITTMKAQWLPAVAAIDGMQDNLPVNHCIFASRNRLIARWDTLLIFGVLYSSAYAPFAAVFPEARWKHHEGTEVMLDILMCIDMVIRLRTSFRDQYGAPRAPLASHMLPICDRLALSCDGIL